MHFSVTAGKYFYCFRLVNINAGHEPVKLPPGQVPDFRSVPWPPVPALGSQSFIDHYDPVGFLQDGFDPVTFSAAEQIKCICVFRLWKLVLNDGA